MRSRLVVFAVLGWFLGVSGPEIDAQAEGGLFGFSLESARVERDLEERFDLELDAANLESWMRRLSARPHHAGSPYGKENAEFMAELFRSWGYETEIEEYGVLFPTPIVRRLEMVAPEHFVASLEEPALDEDSTSSQRSEQLPSYNAYSADGDVEGELVYVNYGIPADYEELARRGIDVAGKIVLARYGGSWRGIKPKVAAENGAIGCILFSDPRDDGYGVGDVYPQGGFRPAEGVQRGSVADMPLYPGDPATPFVGATEDARRLPLDEIPTLTKIPVLPISHQDVLPLLEALEGPVAPAAWRGFLPATYHLGPGPTRVRLQLEFSWDTVPAYNVIAKMIGSESPNQWVVRGNHHDAWVNGATDPVSGMVAVMEEARGVAMLARDGFRPRRTIVYASWDAEEPGLLGSTEWVEHHAAELLEKAVVYINSDSNQRGFLGVGGSHTLQRFVDEVAGDVEDPVLGISIADRVRARRATSGSGAKDVFGGDAVRLSPLGSGSDYTPFLQHLGIASLNIGFRGEGDYGQYHSIYDSFDHYQRFMDPGFDYGIALARFGGRLVLRMANADVLPFEFSRLTERLSVYTEEVEKLADTMRKETETRNKAIGLGMYRVAADPRETWIDPPLEEAVPHLNFAPLHNALAAVKASVADYEAARAAAAAEGRAGGAGLDRALYLTERALTDTDGLPGRPWFVHYIYAPGFYTGYGVKTLPAVREAIEQREWKDVDERVETTAAVLDRFAAAVDRATAVLAAR